jgi:hypothetical protein
LFCSFAKTIKTIVSIVHQEKGDFEEKRIVESGSVTGIGVREHDHWQ